MRYLIILSLFLLSCSRNIGTDVESADGYKIAVIDSCEYIVVENDIKINNNYSFAITHKGNCKNRIHYKNN